MIRRILARFGYIKQDAEPLKAWCRYFGVHCTAWSWVCCTGGLCKYHCDMNCKCKAIPKIVKVEIKPRRV